MLTVASRIDTLNRIACRPFTAMPVFRWITTAVVSKLYTARYAVHDAAACVVSVCMHRQSCLQQQVQQVSQQPYLSSAHVVQDLHGILPVAQLCIGAQQSDVCHDVWLQPGCVHVIKDLLHLHEYSSIAEAYIACLIPHTTLSRGCPFLINIQQ